MFFYSKVVVPKLKANIFSILFALVQVVHPFSSTDRATIWKNSCFILSGRPGFHMIENLSIVVYAFLIHILTSLSVDEIMLPSYVNWSLNFKACH